MWKKLSTIILLAILTTASGCEDESPSPEREDPGEFKIATYNAGLASGNVEYSSQRAPLVTEALAELKLDLLCVQEYWQKGDWDALVSTATSRFPNTVRLAPIEDCQDSICSPLQFEPLQLCVQRMCPDLLGEELAACALTDCSDEVAVLEAGCTDCLIAQIEKGYGIDEIAKSCLGDEEADSGESYLYECGYDTGILTNADIVDQESFVLTSFLVASAVNYAQIETEVGMLHIFCAHFASSISTFEYEGKFGSWKEEQQYQIDQALDFIDKKVSDANPVVLLGDLNTGPGIADNDIEPQWADHYQRIVEAGFTNPYGEQSNVQCTRCPDSTFHSDQSDAQLIDHVLIKGFSGSASGERVLVEIKKIEVDDQEVETHLSDHYGLVVTMREQKKR